MNWSSLAIMSFIWRSQWKNQSSYNFIWLSLYTHPGICTVLGLRGIFIEIPSYCMIWQTQLFITTKLLSCHDFMKYQMLLYWRIMCIVELVWSLIFCQRERERERGLKSEQCFRPELLRHIQKRPGKLRGCTVTRIWFCSNNLEGPTSSEQRNWSQDLRRST